MQLLASWQAASCRAPCDTGFYLLGLHLLELHTGIGRAGANQEGSSRSSYKHLQADILALICKRYGCLSVWRTDLLENLSNVDPRLLPELFKVFKPSQCLSTFQFTNAQQESYSTIALFMLLRSPHIHIIKMKD